MIVTLTGPNDFARSFELEKLVTQFVAEFDDMALERVDAAESNFQRVYDALTNLPFLADRKLVIIKNPSSLKEFGERAETLIQNLPDATDLIMVEPKFDKRSVIYKVLKKMTDFREFNELDAQALSRWLIDEAKQRQGLLDLADARFLIDRIGPSQLLASNELDKLLLFNPQITRQTIEAMTEPTPQSTIFELLEAVFSGNTKRLLELYTEQRALKVEPQQIIAMLTWQFHVLALIKTAGKRSLDQIATEARLNPFVVRKSQSIAGRLSSVALKRLISDLTELDIRLKSESIDADEALRYFLVNLSANA